MFWPGHIRKMKEAKAPLHRFREQKVGLGRDWIAELQRIETDFHSSVAPVNSFELRYLVLFLSCLCISPALHLMLKVLCLTIGPLFLHTSSVIDLYTVHLLSSVHHCTPTYKKPFMSKGFHSFLFCKKLLAKQSNQFQESKSYFQETHGNTNCISDLRCWLKQLWALEICKGPKASPPRSFSK